MEEADKDWMMIRTMGGWMFLLVLAQPGSSGQRAVKQLLLLLLLQCHERTNSGEMFIWADVTLRHSFFCHTKCERHSSRQLTNRRRQHWLQRLCQRQDSVLMKSRRLEARGQHQVTSVSCNVKWSPHHHNWTVDTALQHSQLTSHHHKFTTVSIMDLPQG